MKKILLSLSAVIASIIFVACTAKEKEDVLETEIEQQTTESDDNQPLDTDDNQLFDTVKFKPFVPIELTAMQQSKVSADNRFAFRMFRNVSEMNGENTFFSPLSLNMALGMLYNGASGETRTEMAKALGMEDLTETQINEYYQRIRQALSEIDTQTGIDIANSIWYRDRFSVKQPFIDVNQTYFDALVKAIDFDNPEAAGIINAWCSEKTKGKINEIVTSPISKDIMMYLINALYFKGKWTSEFDKQNTKPDIFTKSDRQEQKVNMMEQVLYFPYYADQYVQCVERPFGNQAFSMVFMLPAENMSIEQLIEHLDDTAWQNIVDNMPWKEIQLKLPRFKVECELPLNEPIADTGMKRIFSGGFANISDNDLSVSQIKQKTYIKIDEKGAEAAAITIIQGVGLGGDDLPPPPPPIPFYANRPFLYLIKEKSTGVILFIGRMDNPEE